MPESAEDATARLVNDYGLGESVALLIASDPPAIGLFEDAVTVATAELVQEGNDDDYSGAAVLSALVANILCNDLYALIKKSAIEEAGDDEDKRASLLNSISADQSTVDSQRLGILVAMIANGTLTTSMAKKILSIMYKEDLSSSPRDIATRNGWEVISDMDVLTQLCTDVVHDPKNTKQLEQYKQGGKNTWKIEKYFTGKVMAQSNGNAHPEKMKEALASVLKKEVPNPIS
jgi:aspartyl-tRNA(Asn)/glutamyl-tRNA(Gln) amidotransferase subunit B